jgi:hypothetical protein
MHIGMSILVHLLMAGRWYAGWTYDGVCALDPSALDSNPRNATHFEWVEAPAFYACDRVAAGGIVAKAEAWMQAPQAALVTLYRFAFVVIVVCGGVGALLAAKGSIRALFVANFKVHPQ